MQFEFDGKVILVTGAASGLGRATARVFAQHGAALCLIDINESGLHEVQTEIEQLGRDCLICCTDISAKVNCEATVTAAIARFGRLDVLCNVAGIIKLAHTVDVTAADWDRIVGVNLSGPFFLSQAAIPHLLKSEGNIVNVASSAAFVGEAYLVPYATTKAGLVHMTKSMAMEFMRQPIRINAVAPGGMMTAMGSTISPPEGMDFELVQRFTGMRGVSQPEEVANLILYLASDNAKFVHGACLSIDGGITAG